MTDHLLDVALQGDAIVLNAAIGAVQEAHDARLEVRRLEAEAQRTGRRRQVADARVWARKLEGISIEALDSSQVRSAVTALDGGPLKLVAAMRVDTSNRDHGQALIVLRAALEAIEQRQTERKEHAA